MHVGIAVLCYLVFVNERTICILLTFDVNLYFSYCFNKVLYTPEYQNEFNSIVKQIFYQYKYSLKWYFPIKANCIWLVYCVYFMLKRCINKLHQFRKRVNNTLKTNGKQRKQFEITLSRPP